MTGDPIEGHRQADGVKMFWKMRRATIVWCVPDRFVLAGMLMGNL